MNIAKNSNTNAKIIELQNCYLNLGDNILLVIAIAITTL